MLAVRDHLDQLGDALPVVITFADDPQRLGAYREHLDIEFPVLADVDRVLYDLLGARSRLDPSGVVAGHACDVRTVVARRGRRLRSPTEDTRQLGADVVVGSDGRIRRVWLPPSPDERPAVAAIIDAVHDAEQ